jgi:hypothetical protein
MTERLFRFSFMTLAVLSLIACSTTPQVDPAIPAALSARGVDKSTQTKVAQGWALDYADILNLVEKKVPAHIIISYLQSTQKPYNLTDSQLGGLQTAGATPQLINYLTETEGFYGVSTGQQGTRMTGSQKRSYLNTRGYQAQQPFGTPLIDEWADPGYEESLYSPFSFD